MARELKALPLAVGALGVAQRPECALDFAISAMLAPGTGVEDLGPALEGFLMPDAAALAQIELNASLADLVAVAAGLDDKVLSVD